MMMNSASDQESKKTIEIISSFNDAINEHNLELTMALMSDDCIFENTYPAPDGERFEGQEEVRGFWKEFFATSSGTRFEFEEVFASNERAFVRWVYHWQNPDGTPGHIRGVDIFKLSLGKIAEKFSYVKG